MACKWRVFKEKLPPSWQPMWVLWDEHGEYLFRTGREALEFVDRELRNREYANRIKRRQEDLWSGS